MVDSVGAISGNSFHSLSGVSKASNRDEELKEKKLGEQNFNLEDNIFKPDNVASKAGLDGVKGADETGGALAENKNGLFNFDETSGALASGQLDWLEQQQKQGGLSLVA